MDSAQASNLTDYRSTSGVALFMVIASVSVLAILVTEFTYIANINQSIAYGGLDQIKAHYLAKSGLKLSLLRLKAYTQVKQSLKALGGSGAVPKALIEKIWNFPFMYPIPTQFPGISKSEQLAIEKFQAESNLEGSYSASIESESSKYNLNLIIDGFAPSPSPSPSTSGVANTTSQPMPQATFNVQAARDGLENYITTLITQRSQTDPDFAVRYRDLRLPDLMDSFFAWADRKYERRSSSSHDPVPLKRAPFYSTSEMHQLPLMDEELYHLLEPHLTASTTLGINVNTIKAETLKALIPQMTPEEITDFFKFRDSTVHDNQFTDSAKFYDYLKKSVSIFRNNEQEINQFQAKLAERSILLITEESLFKITVRAQVNYSNRVIEAWVMLGAQSNGGKIDPGLKITHMRIL